jgi:cytochrome o ubiquinol oxidase subunit 1
MPLYALGFMGMTRRLNATTNPEWVPYLYVAMFGAVMIAFGIACQLIQLYVSVRDRNKPENMCDTVTRGMATPWNGRPRRHLRSTTSLCCRRLTASTRSPKPRKTVLRTRLRPSTNRSTCEQHRHRRGGALLTVFGFAMIWHIWWLDRQPGGTVIYFAIHAARDDQGYMVPDVIERIEAEQHKRLVAAGKIPATATRVETSLEQA